MIYVNNEQVAMNYLEDKAEDSRDYHIFDLCDVANNFTDIIGNRYISAYPEVGRSYLHPFKVNALSAIIDIATKPESLVGNPVVPVNPEVVRKYTTEYPNRWADRSGIFWGTVRSLSRTMTNIGSTNRIGVDMILMKKLVGSWPLPAIFCTPFVNFVVKHSATENKTNIEYIAGLPGERWMSCGGFVFDEDNMDWYTADSPDEDNPPYRHEGVLNDSYYKTFPYQFTWTCAQVNLIRAMGNSLTELSPVTGLIADDICSILHPEDTSLTLGNLTNERLDKLTWEAMLIAGTYVLGAYLYLGYGYD